MVREVRRVSHLRGASKRGRAGGVGGSDPSRRGPETYKEVRTRLRTRSASGSARSSASHRGPGLHVLEESSRSSGAAGAGGGSLRGVRINERQIEMEGHASHTFSSIQARLAIKPCAHRVATCTKTGARPSKGSAPHGNAAARKRAAFARRAGGAAVAFQKIPPIAAPRRAAHGGRRRARAAPPRRRAGAARPQNADAHELHTDIVPTAGKTSPRWPLP